MEALQLELLTKLFSAVQLLQGSFLRACSSTNLQSNFHPFKLIIWKIK